MLEDDQEIKDRITNMEGKVEDIHAALLGDLYNPDKGLVKRLGKVEAYQEQDRLLKAKIEGRVWGIVLIGTPVVSFVYWLIQNAANG